MRFSGKRQQAVIFTLLVAFLLQITVFVPEIGSAATPVAFENGVRVDYFDSINTGNFKLSESIEDNIDFEWGSKAPTEHVSSTNYSVRYTGRLVPSVTGQYTFYTISTGGVRLWIDDRLIIDNWSQHELTENRNIIARNLTADREYRFKLEYSNSNKESVIKLLWECPELAKEIIPLKNFVLPKGNDFYDQSDKDKDGIPDSWENEGYTFDSKGVLEKWDGDVTKVYFKTNPEIKVTNGSSGENDRVIALNYFQSSKKIPTNNPMISTDSYSSSYYATIVLEDDKNVKKTYGVYVGSVLDPDTGTNPKNVTKPAFVTVAQSIGRSFGTFSNDNILIDDEGLNSSWNIYFADNDLENAVGQMREMFDKNLLNVVLKPGMTVTLFRDKEALAPYIKWSSYSNTLSTICASICAGTNNRITDVSAVLKIDGVETTLKLDNAPNSAFYYNEKDIIGKINPDFTGKIIVTYLDSSNSTKTVESMIGTSPIMNKSDAMYVELATPVDVFSTSDYVTGKKNGSIETTQLLTDYPDAESYVFEVTSDRWSSTAGKVTINDQTTFLGTGDQSIGDAVSPEEYSVRFYYEINYYDPANHSGAKLMNQNMPVHYYGTGDKEFRSTSTCVVGGNKVVNDQVKSMRLSKGVTVIAYEDNDFNGKSNTYRGDIHDMGNLFTSRQGDVLIDFAESILKKNISFQMSSFKILAPRVKTTFDSAKHSPVHSNTLVVKRPENKFTIEWSDFLESRLNSVLNDTNASVKIKLIGYYSNTQGDKFELYKNSQGVNTDGKIQIPSESDMDTITANTKSSDIRKAVMDTIDGYATTLQLSTADASAYLVKVSSEQISSSNAKIKLNSSEFNLATSDSHDNGQSASAEKSPYHSEMFYVPANSSYPKNMAVSVDLGEWKESSSTTPKIKIEVLGYFASDNKMVYKQLSNKEIDEYLIKGLSTTDTASVTCELYKNKVLTNLPKAYVVKVTTNGVGSDSVEVKVNDQTTNHGTSATVNGDGKTPKPVTHSSYMLVEADPSNPYKFTISSSIDQAFKVDGTIDVQVSGYFY